MSWASKLLELCRRYGKPAKLAASSILGAILPGSPAVIALVEQAFDTAEEKGQDHWEMKVDQRLDASAGDLERLGEVLDLLQGELQHLTAQVVRLPDFAPQIIETALTSDARCQEAARRLESLAGRFDRLERQQERLLAGQANMLPLLRRTVGVCDYIDELRAAGFSVEVFGELLRAFQAALRLLGAGHVHEAEQALERVSAARPLSAAATVALAASQAAGHNFLQAEQTLTRALRLNPHDPELTELHRQATSLSRRGDTPLDRLASARRQLREGDTLDGWLLESLIGHGGWGLVFRASRDGRIMAIKIMHAELSADPLFVERFKREIITLAKLGKHPHLVEIDSFGYAVDHGCWYFVMEWVEGVTLDHSLIHHGAIGWPVARELFRQLADGLAEAHRRGIVHRDIKPANIMLRPDGRPVLVDFGLALETSGGLTRTGRSAGYTALFAAPEQIRKNQADARSDVYSLAASLYYALMHDDPDHREPHRYKPRFVPEPAQDLLTRALDNDPAERPDDAAGFRELLQGFARPVILDARGGGDFTSLEEAVRKAPVGSQVLVRPGLYRGSLVLDRSLEIVGDGPRDNIIIESEAGSCLSVRAGETTIRSLTLRGSGQRRPTVEVVSGRLNLENCAVSSETSVCLSATSSSARLALKGCLLHDSKEQGVLLSGGAGAALEDCEVARMGGPGIEVQQGCSLALQRCDIHTSASSGLFITSKDVTVDRCRIHDNALANIMVKRGGAPAIRDSVIHGGKQVGLFFLEGGGGLVEGCEITDNARAGVETKHGSNPILRRCHIHDGRQSGVFVSEGGRGTFEDCDIAGNALSGIESKSDGNPLLHRCRIRDNRANGVCVYERGGGVIEECDIFGNLSQGVSVKDESKPVLRNVRSHDNKECGLLIHAQGAGLFEDCDVFGNGLANVEIKEGGHPILRRCKMRDGKVCGILIWVNGTAQVEDCDITGNAYAGVEIKQGANPTFVRCRVTGNGGSGFYIHEQGGGTIEGCDIKGNKLGSLDVSPGCRVRRQGNVE